MSTAVGSHFDLGCMVSALIFGFCPWIFSGFEKLAVTDSTAVPFVGCEEVHSGLERGLGKKRRCSHSLKGPVQLSGLKLCVCVKANMLFRTSFTEVSLLDFTAVTRGKMFIPPCTKTLV